MLPVPSSGRIDTLIHLSDIHIRTGDREHSRYDEYLCVFERTIQRISGLDKIKEGGAAVVITGDIFHVKCKVESSGLHLYTYLIKGLSALCPVYIIPGNHDIRQDAPEIPDMISGFFPETKDVSVHVDGNVAMITKTGTYCIGDVGFGVVDIRDALLSGAGTGRAIELPNFPMPETKIKVALFHGTIHDEYSYPLSWFNGFDYGLFGDIHKQQVHKEEKYNIHWGYSGSLVQQNFGESLWEHGFLEWNLRDNSCRRHLILNDFGSIKVFYKDGWCVSDENSEYLLDDFHTKVVDNLGGFPNILKVRILGKLGDFGKIEELECWMKSKCICMRALKSLSLFEEEDNSINISRNEHMLGDLSKCSNLWEDFLKERHDPIKVVDFLKDPGSYCKIPEDLEVNKEKIQKRNVDIEQCISNFMDSKEKIRRKERLVLHYMEFQWILCYGEGNYFNFDTLMSNVSMLSAPNGYGKTSFLETICFALFGAVVGSRYNKNTSGSVLCAKCPQGKLPHTAIRFSLGGNTFEIFRSFRYQRKDALKLSKGTTELRSGSNVIKSGSAVDTWVKKELGKCEDFLMSCLVSQNQDCDFLSMKSSEQLDILDNCLNLDALRDMEHLLKISQQSLKWTREHMDTAYQEVKRSLDNITPETFSHVEDNVEDNVDLESTSSLFDEQILTLQDHVKNLRVEYDTIDVLSVNEKMELDILSGDDLNDDLSVSHNEDELENLSTRVVLLERDIEKSLQEKISFCDEISFVDKPELSKEAIEHEMKIIYDERRRIPEEYLHTKPSQSGYEADKVVCECMKALRDVYYIRKTELKERYDVLETQLQLYEENVELPPKPNRRLDDVKWDLKYYDDNKSTYEKYGRRELSYGEYLEKEEKLKKDTEQSHNDMNESSIRLVNLHTKVKDFPFNKECWACSQQPIQKELRVCMKECELLKSKYESVVKVYDDFTKDKDVSEIRKSRDEMVAWCKHYESIDISFVKGEYMAWNKFQEAQGEYIDKRNTFKKEIRGLYDDIQYITNEIELLTKNRVELMELCHIKKIALDIAIMDTRERNLAEKREKWEQYDRYCEYKEQQECIRRRDLLGMEREDIMVKMNAISNQIRYNRFIELERKKENDKVKFEKKKIIEEKEKEITELIIKSTEIATKENAREEAREEARKYAQRAMIEQMESQMESKKNQLQLKIESLDDKYMFIQSLSKSFMSFRTWVYKNNILPHLTKTINKIVGNMLEGTSRPIYIDVGLNDKELLWVVRDGTNCIQIEKTSGFQRFILGLCTRISLACIGASTLSCSQLFLDEGFVACDSSNLHRVPRFISSLIGIYDGVLLMSHLETIQDSVENKIKIERKEDLSLIRFGEKEYIMTLKKGGRPVKKSS